MVPAGDYWLQPARALAAAIVGPFAMLCYLTVMLRYHIDLWPMLGLPALFGVAGLAQSLAQRPERRKLWIMLLMLLVLATVFVSIYKTMDSRATMAGDAEPWSAKYCLKLTEKKGFDLARSREICSLDAQGNDLL
jgi:hypothetical protein